MFLVYILWMQIFQFPIFSCNKSIVQTADHTKKHRTCRQLQSLYLRLNQNFFLKKKVKLGTYFSHMSHVSLFIHIYVQCACMHNSNTANGRTLAPSYYLKKISGLLLSHLIISHQWLCDFFQLIRHIC